MGRAVSEIPTCARATFSSLSARSLSLWRGVVRFTDRGPASSFQSEAKVFEPPKIASTRGRRHVGMHYYPRPVFLPTKSACKTARSCKHSRCMAVLVRNALKSLQNSFALKSLQNSLMSASQISQDVTARRKNAVSPNSS